MYEIGGRRTPTQSFCLYQHTVRGLKGPRYPCHGLHRNRHEDEISQSDKLSVLDSFPIFSSFCSGAYSRGRRLYMKRFATSKAEAWLLAKKADTERVKRLRTPI